MKKRQEKKHNRKHFKLDTFPAPIKKMALEMLETPTMTYMQVQKALAKEGYPISISSLSRYYADYKKLAQQYIEAREKMQVLVDEVKKNPSLDYAQVANNLVMQKLLKLVSTSTDDVLMEGINLAQATKALAELQKAIVQVEKHNKQYEQGVEEAAARIELKVNEKLGNDPIIKERLAEIIEDVKSNLIKENKEGGK
ncbi:phage protein Gp27 family protein [Vallitalea guaymasensis]|uniref:phage protein Gp27 family protein n=1 Tax=Vallitalea guaymasensis TaxID=1185412 RepID=UPI000DE50C7C|nr:phage protein Gp27 family protein [Vallitalea guaymasensis]